MIWSLLDRIEACEPGKTLKGVKCFSRSEQFFQDHFPGYPVVPGVLLIEVMAQAGGKCIRLLDPNRVAFLVKVKNASFNYNVIPGDECVAYAKIKKLNSEYAVADAHIEVRSQKVCSAEIRYVVKNTDKVYWNDPVMDEWTEYQNRSIKFNLLSSIDRGY